MYINTVQLRWYAAASRQSILIFLRVTGWYMVVAVFAFCLLDKNYFEVVQTVHYIRISYFLFSQPFSPQFYNLSYSYRLATVKNIGHCALVQT